MVKRALDLNPPDFGDRLRFWDWGLGIGVRGRGLRLQLTACGFQLALVCCSRSHREGGWGGRFAGDQASNPKFQIPNHILQSPIPKPQTPNPKPQTLNCKQHIPLPRWDAARVRDAQQMSRDRSGYSHMACASVALDDVFPAKTHIVRLLHVNAEDSAAAVQSSNS